MDLQNTSHIELIYYDCSKDTIAYIIIYNTNDSIRDTCDMDVYIFETNNEYNINNTAGCLKTSGPMSKELISDQGSIYSPTL